MLSKYTIIGLIVGIIISGLGIFSAIDYFTNPIEFMDFNDNFGVGESTIFQFESPENSLQKLMITGDSFDVKILTPGNKEKFDDSKLSVKTGWTAKIDFKQSLIIIKDKNYHISPIGKAAQELILTQGLENWVKKRI